MRKGIIITVSILSAIGVGGLIAFAFRNKNNIPALSLSDVTSWTPYIDVTNESMNNTQVNTASGGINNPGNITKTYDINKNITYIYDGEIPSSSANFKSFSSMTYGFKAMITTLRYYYNHLSLHTLRDLINEYAPPKENDTDSYINYLVQQTNIDPDDDLNDVLFSNKINPLITAMATIEQGHNFVANISNTDIMEAVQLS